MDRDICLKPFIPYDMLDSYNLYGLNNSCWLDSLFVALFHNNTESIKRFINDLKPKIYNNENKIELEKYNEDIIQHIIEQYNIINESSESNDTKKKKIIICRKIRYILEQHRQTLKKDYYSSFLNTNSVLELLNYLKEHVLDTNSFKNIHIKEVSTYQISTELSVNSLEDIQFINIQYKGSEFRTFCTELKKNLSNYYLNSIIVHDGVHYMCYYKCNSLWYFYNDLSSTIKEIGSYKNLLKNKDVKTSSTLLLYT